MRVMVLLVCAVLYILASTSAPGAFAGRQAANSHGVVPVYPKGIALDRGDSIAFVWKPYPKAVNYILQIWIWRPSATTDNLGGYSTGVTDSVLVKGRSSYAWNASNYLPGVYQYDIVPLDKRGNALALPGTIASFTLTS